MEGKGADGNTAEGIWVKHNGNVYLLPFVVLAENVKTDPEHRFLTDGEIEKIKGAVEKWEENGKHDHDERYYRIGAINKNDIVFELNHAVRWENSAFIQSNRPQELTIAASQEDGYKILYGIRDGKWAFAPNDTGKLQLGTAEYGWAGVYSTGGFNSASDKRLKTDFRSLDGYDIEGFVKDLQVVFFRYKHDKNKTYCGLMAQDVEELVKKHGLPGDFALLEKVPAKGGGENDYRYAVDYTQLIGLMLHIFQKHTEWF